MLFKKLDMLTGSDFEIFRIPFESGRQTLKNLKKGLIFGIIMQAFFGLFVYATADPSVYPGIEKTILIAVSYTITTILIVLSIIYIIPANYKRNQHIQYLTGSLALLNVSGISLYFISMLIIKRETKISNVEFFPLIGVSLTLLIIFFIVTLIRVYVSIKKGNYRKESTKHNYEKKLNKDKGILTKIPEFAIGLTGVLLIIQYAVSRISYVDTSIFIIVLLSLILPYLSVYMFVHSIITYYCKKRFASFNFDEEGNLQPIGSEDKVKDQKMA